MKKVTAPSLILIGLFAAGSAMANPYASWQSVSSDDDTVKIDDSFNRSYDKTINQDNDVNKHYEANRSTDIDVTKTTDVDVTKNWTKTTDIDVTKNWTHTTDIDAQVATPTMDSYKYQDQDAGHQADTQVLGAARGHSVGVTGGPTVVKAGNDEQVFYGPSMHNTNINQLPQNNAFIDGDSNGLSMSNTFAGRDMGNKGVFAPVGNTSAAVSGDVLQRSGAQVGQQGDSSNRIADPFSSTITK